MSKEDRKKKRRERTIDWEDPMVVAKLARDRGGKAFLQGVKEGIFPQPPIARLMGYRLAEVATGRVAFELEPAEYHFNPLGSVHGGVISTLLDSSMTSAIMSALPEGVACTTIEIKVNYIRPVLLQTGLVRAEAETIHVGRKIATAQGKLFDKSGKLYAHGTTTSSVFDVPK